MQYEDISGLSHKELVKKSKELRSQMFELRMKNSLGQLTNPMSIRDARRDVARLKTAMTAKAEKAGSKGK
jgi:large subunit ribosomal protein L29